MEDLLNKYEREYLRILCMHSWQIELEIKVNNTYGELMYSSVLTVKNNKGVLHSHKSYFGKNLWKQYSKICKYLTEIYGDNLYVYEGEPIK